MASGGDILEIDCKDPVLGQFKFFPIAGEDSSFDAGGVRNEDTGTRTAQGQKIYTKVDKSWEVEVTVLWDDINGSEDIDLSRLSAVTNEQLWTIRRINGVVYRGTGQPVGDIKASGKDSKITFKIQGSGKLEPIA